MCRCVESFEQRRNVRKALSEDKEWMESYISKMMPWLTKQENAVVFNFGKEHVDSGNHGAGGVYDLRTIRVKPGTAGGWAKHSETLAFYSAYRKHAKHIGTWKSDAGPLDTVLQLWRFNSGDERLKMKDIFQSADESDRFVKESHSQLIVPTKFSPLQ